MDTIKLGKIVKVAGLVIAGILIVSLIAFAIILF